MRLGSGTFFISINEPRASCISPNQPTQKQNMLYSLPGFHRGTHVLGAHAALFLLIYWSCGVQWVGGFLLYKFWSISYGIEIFTFIVSFPSLYIDLFLTVLTSLQCNFEHIVWYPRCSLVYKLFRVKYFKECDRFKSCGYTCTAHENMSKFWYFLYFWIEK